MRRGGAACSSSSSSVAVVVAACTALVLAALLAPAHQGALSSMGSAVRGVAADGIQGGVSEVAEQAGENTNNAAVGPDAQLGKSKKPRAPGMWDEPEFVPDPLRSYSIGITISIPKDPSSMYTNGAKQASFFLYELLTYKERHNVIFLNLDGGDPSNAPEEWQLGDLTVVRYEEALTLGLDIVIELGMQMRQDQVDRLQLRGTKVVAYRSGNNFVMTSENMIYNKTASTMFATHGYDHVWTLPSFNRSNSFLSMIYRAPVSVAPYLWSPRFFDFVVGQLTERFYYSNRGSNKTVATFEPNINVVKSSLIPITIAELLHRDDPSLIHRMYVTNSGSLSSNPEFARFVRNSLTIYADKRMFFEKRYRFGWFLSEHVDVVLSHQWANELNYLFIEALYSGYPLVHNSPYFKDCGYFYEESNSYEGKERLRQALTEHDANAASYNAKARECVWKYSTVNPENILEWDRIMNDVVNNPRRPELLERLAKTDYPDSPKVANPSGDAAAAFAARI